MKFAWLRNSIIVTSQKMKFAKDIGHIRTNEKKYSGKFYSSP